MSRSINGNFAFIDDGETRRNDRARIQMSLCSDSFARSETTTRYVINFNIYTRKQAMADQRVFRMKIEKEKNVRRRA